MLQEAKLLRAHRQNENHVWPVLWFNLVYANTDIMQENYAIVYPVPIYHSNNNN